jgi:hypothetical protein
LKKEKKGSSYLKSHRIDKDFVAIRPDDR